MFVKFTTGGKPVYYTISHLRNLGVAKVIRQHDDKCTQVHCEKGPANNGHFSVDESVEDVVKALTEALSPTKD